VKDLQKFLEKYDVEKLKEESEKRKWGCLLQYPLEFVNWLLKYNPKNILDIGCHVMHLKAVCEKIIPQIRYVGLDIIDYGSKPDILTSVEEIPLDDDSFEAISCIETIEHVYNYVKALEEIYRVCKKTVFLQFPHPKSTGSYEDTTHYHIIHPITMKRLLEKIGFKVVEEKEDVEHNPAYLMILEK